MEILIQILSMIGLTHLIIEFQPIKWFLGKIMYTAWGWIPIKLLTCYQCLSFWVSFAIYQDFLLSCMISLFAWIFGEVKNK